VLHWGEFEISATQNDIRQIQMAKAAPYGGVKLLVDKIGTQSLQRICLAGAFGSQINVKYAMVLGLMPDCSLGQVSFGGNAERHRRPYHAAEQTIEGGN
jgi:uncharacterized 2Fe-2S/4Fe-4S cluster protein (DUF4445 family)